MNSDDFVKHMPENLKIEFISWIAKRDRKIGLREFQAGYEHGWHDGYQGNPTIHTNTDKETS